ncbi:hypothetical protein CAEBREN_11415 [Caenorhabditis brenneri]|uniref:BTB domain-containing protein n=1 Tax=Caenorhabditis brenneri TaxID=135651 RepID=G0MDR3_CAEBE|nr:hypothetical protein CAEBREN_11415 [Caenorhabditis brenneri]
MNLYKTTWCLENTLRLCDFDTPSTDWSIAGEYEAAVVGRGKSLTLMGRFEFTNKKRSLCVQFSSPHVLKFLSNRDLKVRWLMKVKKMTGVDIKRLNKRSLDHDERNMTLEVSGEKIRVNKHLLSHHSTYFKAIFSNRPDQSRIKLYALDPIDFRDFMNVIHQKKKIDDDNLEGILYLASLYSAKIVLKLCEKFLIDKSDRSLEMKFESALRYKLKNLQEFCFSKIHSKDDIQVIVNTVNEKYMTKEIWKTLLYKSLEID